MNWHYIFTGDPNKKMLKKLQPMVEMINGFESPFAALTDDQLRAKTGEFKERVAKGETLDHILPEAFAAVREASKRTPGMRHFDVQLVGGVALHQGKIAEMRTGEGKTLVATLPVYLNALEGKGVHVVTVNDYLAKRDAVWMGKIYDFLGMSVGIIQNQRVTYLYDKTSDVGPLAPDQKESFKIEDEYLRPCTRQEAYRADITYGTNNEFGFDYLRDNMVQDFSQMVMRPGSEMHYAIIDEIDSILVDEARTPLIISSPAEEATEQYYRFAQLVKQLKENEDYNIDEKMRSATLTDHGVVQFEQWLGVENLYVEGGIRMLHHIEQALKAEYLFKRDKEYVVDNDEVIIIDEFTGRKMPGRRYSEGLHQAIEAKEGVAIQRESQTLATITFQNLFRMYRKLSGMTGTAKTEEEEFFKIYGLEVFVIPTNKLDHRIDHSDRIYKHNKAKYRAVAEKIRECQAKGQPVLVGTISVEKNEELSLFLTGEGIVHQVLNAKNHEREGEIIAQAGRPGSVTLATNMAGRGVDIKLGGNPVDQAEEAEVLAAGGLFVLGTERHESRRIDNQLRGRSARQGDPGETQFFVSTQDDLMRIFAGDRLQAVMNRFQLPEDVPIEQKMISRMLESAQKKVEGFHFDSRKHVLQYDDVLNRHRAVIYGKRRQILEVALKEQGSQDGASVSAPAGAGSVEDDQKAYAHLKDMILDMIEEEIEFVVSFHTNEVNVSETSASDVSEKNGWNIQEIIETMKTIFPLEPEDERAIHDIKAERGEKFDNVKARDAMVDYLFQKARQEYEKVEEAVFRSVEDTVHAQEHMRAIEKNILLRAIDTLWVEHLISIDYLRTGIGLRGYGQRDPLVEYKKESYHLFHELLANIQKEVVYSFFKIGAGIQLAPTIMATDKMTLQGAKKSEAPESVRIDHKPRDEEGKKIGRNDPCPCGSGRKYKRCHGA